MTSEHLCGEMERAQAAAIRPLSELGLHSLTDTLKTPKNPALSTFGFVLWNTIGSRPRLQPLEGGFAKSG
ncbi:hypothetical protein [Stakelama saccharophila]|uniref:Uncharacterized protein n=1 Tax=Stakelama saccharophila TaxID=3075605 RepID=A0ABZ0B876_9SPHN|nr:hypothetical protein [Stakelama sp. W311]WNO53630.1 hypothetical protein RPR59_14525 [Stakelama sp. W311]